MARVEGHIGDYDGVGFYDSLNAILIDGKNLYDVLDPMNFYPYLMSLDFVEETGQVYNLEKMIERKYVEVLKDIASYEREFFDKEMIENSLSLSIITYSLEDVKDVTYIKTFLPGRESVNLPFEDVLNGYCKVKGSVSLPYTVHLTENNIYGQYDENLGETNLNEIKDFLDREEE